MKVFISGPVSGHPDYKEKFKEIELKLAEQGYSVINPSAILDLDANGESNVDHLSKYQENMNNCYELIDECDAIFHMNEWNKSHGCQQEHRYATIKGKILMYEEYMFK